MLKVGDDVLKWIKEKLQEKIVAIEKCLYRKPIAQAQLQETDFTKNLWRLRQERNDALSRPSELMSLKLRDGNLNVVDLSDEYRPTKLAELRSKLYDNEWTNAYESLETNTDAGETCERQYIQFLLDILLETFELLWKHLQGRVKILESMTGGDNVVVKTEDKKLLKDLRKNYAIERLQDMKNHKPTPFVDELRSRFTKVGGITA